MIISFIIENIHSLIHATQNVELFTQLNPEILKHLSEDGRHSLENMASGSIIRSKVAQQLEATYSKNTSIREETIRAVCEFAKLLNKSTNKTR